MAPCLVLVHCMCADPGRSVGLVEQGEGSEHWWWENGAVMGMGRKVDWIQEGDGFGASYSEYNNLPGSVTWVHTDKCQQFFPSLGGFPLNKGTNVPMPEGKSGTAPPPKMQCTL